MKTSVVAQSSPFKQEMLSLEECYILDNGVDKNVFVWKGVSLNVHAQLENQLENKIDHIFFSNTHS